MYVYSLHNASIYIVQAHYTLQYSAQNIFSFKGKSNLVLRIHGYLQRYGFINYGIFTRQNPMHGKMPFKVVVVGGGVSGLMAARQLTYFGLDVSILEARVSERVFVCGGEGLCWRKGEDGVREGSRYYNLVLKLSTFP